MQNTQNTLAVTATDLARDAADVINTVVYGGRSVVITRHGKPVARIEAYTQEEPVVEGEYLDSPDQGSVEYGGESSYPEAVVVAPVEQKKARARRVVAYQEVSVSVRKRRKG